MSELKLEGRPLNSWYTVSFLVFLSLHCSFPKVVPIFLSPRKNRSVSETDSTNWTLSSGDPALAGGDVLEGLWYPGWAQSLLHSLLRVPTPRAAEPQGMHPHLMIAPSGIPCQLALACQPQLNT